MLLKIKQEKTDRVGGHGSILHVYGVVGDFDRVRGCKVSGCGGWLRLVSFKR